MKKMTKLLLIMITLVLTLACSFNIVNDLAPGNRVTLSAPLTDAETMDRIEREVIEIRGLQPNDSVERALLSSEQLRENVISDFFGEYSAEDAADDHTELVLLGLIADDFDVYQFYIDLYSEKVAGYYDQETKQMFVVADGEFGGVEKMTYAHEYTHVLQDQIYDLENGLKLNQDYCRDHTEYCAGVQTLIEGDATFTEQYWLINYAGQDVIQDIMDFYEDYSSPVYDSAPYYMQKDFYFPYETGLAFIQHLYDENGWDAIAEAYTNPPVTTEQVIHPERYPSDVPVDIPLPDYLPALGNGWREMTRNVMGEWYIYLILAAGQNALGRLDEDTASAAAAGWGGDSYLVYRNDSTQETAFIMSALWDTPGDASEFWSALQAYGMNRWGPSPVKTADRWVWQLDGQYASILNDQGNIIWVIAPDQGIAETLLNNLR